jgi:pimeloyl-ACP methyl ester carboxylesterase
MRGLGTIFTIDFTMRTSQLTQIAISSLLFLGLAMATLTPLSGQDAKKKTEIPKPEDITLETKDGVQLRCTFYLGTAKKESVPLILVHGWGGQRSEFHSLALGLQSVGHTVIVPDLRGHGQSTIAKAPGGETKDIDPEKFRAQEVKSMVYDLEACKKYLLEKNNEGECNIEMLTVIGSELGSILALHFAAIDWNFPILPAFKQGQDVKALVLLSPASSEKGLTLREPLAHPAIKSKLSVMLVAGSQDSKSAAEVKRMYNSLQASRPKVDEDDNEAKLLKLDLFKDLPETSLRGTKLLGAGLPIPAHIARFLELRLLAKQEEFAWAERRKL